MFNIILYFEEVDNSLLLFGELELLNTKKNLKSRNFKKRQDILKHEKTKSLPPTSQDEPQNLQIQNLNKQNQ